MQYKMHRKSKRNNAVKRIFVEERLSELLSNVKMAPIEPMLVLVENQINNIAPSQKQNNVRNLVKS